MNEKPLKVGEIAKRVGVDPNTIRNYARRYATYLSKQANPQEGNERLFSTRDMNVINYIKSSLDGGMKHAELASILAEKSFSADDVDVIVGMPEVLPPEDKPTAQEGQGEALGLQIILSSHQSQLDEIRQEIATVKAKVSTGANQLVTGIVIGAAIVLVLVAILLNGVY